MFKTKDGAGMLVPGNVATTLSINSLINTSHTMCLDTVSLVSV
jgi:hypothetical protein